MTNPTRILIVEDNPNDYELAQREIRKSMGTCEIKRVETETEYLAALASRQPDVILSDYGLPNFDGMKALKLAQEHATLTPFIIWTGSLSEEVAAECMKAGANNYILKGNITRLGPAVLHALEERQLLLEHKEAEDKLRSSESNYRALVENSLQGIAIFQKRKIVYVNPAMCAIMGYKAEELLEMSEGQILALTHPDDLATSQQRAIKRQMGEPVSSLSDVRIVRKDGTIRWIQTFTNSIEYDGQPAILSTSIDITERKQAEGKFQAIYEDSPVGIFQSTPQGKFISLNSAMARIYGYDSPEDMIQSITDIARTIYLQPEDRIGFTELVEDRDIVREFECRNVRKDGSVFWASTSARVVRDPSGTVLYYEGFLQDITGRKEADESLIANEKRFRALIANGMDNISLLAEDGTLLWEDPSTNFVLGYERERFVGESILQLLHPDDVQRINRLFAKSVKERGSLQEATFRLRHRDGTWRWIESRATNMLDEPSVKAIVLNYRDVTERMQAEIELQHKNDDLRLLNVVNNAIVRGQNLDSIVDLLTVELNRTFSAVGSTIYILSADKRSLTMQQYSLSPEIEHRIEKLLGFKIPKIQIPIREGSHFHNALITKQSTITSDPQKIQEWLAEFTETSFLPPIARKAVRKLVPHIYKLLNIKSTISVPLISQEEVIGFLDVSSADLFTQDDLKRIERIGEQLTSLIQRQQANEKLRRSEDFLQSVQNALSAHIAILDEEGNIVQVNSAWRKFAEANGLEHPNYGIGLNYLAICDSATGPNSAEAPLVAKAIREVIAGHRKEAWVEYSCHSPDENRWFVLRVTKFDDGDHAWVVLAHENITERVNAEKAFMESTAQFRTLFEASPDAIMLIDPVGDWPIIDCNSAAAKMNGYTRQELIGKSIDFLNPEPDTPESHLAYLERMKSVEVLRYEAVHIHKDGTPIAIEVSTTLMQLGDRIIVLGIDRDITQRKQAERIIRDLARFPEENPTPILRASRDGQILYSNAAGTDWLNGWNRTIGGDLPDDWKKRVGETYEKNIKETFEFTTQGKIYSTLIVPIQESGYVNLYGRDITEAKEAEEKVQESQQRYRALFEDMPIAVWEEDFSELKKYLDSLKRQGITDFPRYFEIHPEAITQCAAMIKILDVNNSALQMYETTSKQELIESTYAEMSEGEREHNHEDFIAVAEGRMSNSWEGSEQTLKGNPIELSLNWSVVPGHEEDYSKVIVTTRDITKRKRAEEELRQSEKRYRTVVENQNEFIVRWKHDGVRTFVNDAYCRYFGITSEQALNTDFVPHILEEDRPGVERKISRLLSGSTSIETDIHRVSRSDGSIGWQEWTDQAIYGDHGKLVEFQSVGRDITERKQAEEALRESEEKYRLLFDSNPLPMWIFDLETLRFLKVNRSAIDHYGYTENEFMAMTIKDIRPPVDVPKLLQKVSDVRGGIEEAGVWNHVTKGGSVIEVEIVSHLVEFDGRRAELVLANDITERVRAEQELRASEERFRQLADNIQEVFWMTDTVSGEELYISPAAESVWGCSPEYLMKAPEAFLNSIASEDQPMVASSLESQRRGEKTEIEYRIIHPDGSVHWVRDRAFPIFDETGRTVRLAGIAADVTERKQAEMALLRSQARYHDLFDNSPISLWEEDYSLVKQKIESLQQNGVTDLDEYLSAHLDVTVELASLVKIVDVNRVTLQLYHVRRKEDLLRSLTEFISDETLQQFRNEIMGLIHKSRFEWEGKDQTLDGRELMVMVNGSIPPGYEEDWSKVIVSISDITERKRTEDALRESEEKLQNIIQHSGSMFYSHTSDHLLIYVSPQSRTILDCEPGEAMVHWQELLSDHPANIQGIESTERAVRTGQPQPPYELELITRKNRRVWVQVDESPLVQEGKTVAIVGSLTDITERKRAEQEATRHLAELEALYENGLAVGRLLEPKEIGSHIIQTFARYLSWHHVAIRLLNAETDKLELIAFNQPDLSDEERTEIESRFNRMVSNVGQGLSGWAMQTGTSIRTGNVHTHPQYVDTHEGIKSGLYMPLKLGDRIIGCISVESDLADAFTLQDERLLATLANQAAIAFENARLYQAAQLELSERRRAQEALRVSETHYRQLADSITDILFELDQDLRYTHWNKASEMFSGIPEEDAIGRSIGEMFGNSNEQLEREEIYRVVLQERQARIFETAVIAKGQKRYLEISAYPSATGVSVVAKDITERRLTGVLMQKRFQLIEFAARHSLEDVMQRTIDEVSELTESHIGFLHFVDEDQNTIRFQTWSSETLRLMNGVDETGMHSPVDAAGLWADAVRQRRSIIHNDYESLPDKKGLPQEHIPVIREMVVPIIRNETIAAVLGVGNKTGDYTLHDLELVERFADYAWDIAERKQMENTLAAERNQLAQRVEERTADLSRANSNLARALRVKDEFLANMSHELRTPLNAILGLSESLGEQVAGPLNEKQQKYLGTINESGHHLLSLINDILDLAKIEAGQISLDINKVDVNSVCQASLRMIKQLAQRKNQEVHFEIEPGLGLMWADERRLKQMMVNLLSNAVKFTPESGDLGLEVRGDQEGNKISISVWDRGIGINSNDIERIFKPFVQLDSGLAREAAGTGLGLALVSQMAKLHGGSVTVESQTGQGSRFTIMLPWEPALAGEANTRLRSTGKFRAIKLNEIRPTILLIEDTREVVMMLVDYLEMAGFNMVTAQDGVDGLTQAKIAHPDLILMDIQMPRMDGFETTIKLRSDPEFKETPIIALTALAMPNDRQRCLDVGMNEYLSKPVNLKALVKTIKLFLFEAEADQS